LRAPVTTTSRLKMSPEHRVYIIRDIKFVRPPAKTRPYDLQTKFKFEPITLEEPKKTTNDHLPREKVIAIGLLKVGPKNLYVNVYPRKLTQRMNTAGH
jgi:hypothetical protein